MTYRTYELEDEKKSRLLGSARFSNFPDDENSGASTWPTNATSVVFDSSSYPRQLISVRDKESFRVKISSNHWSGSFTEELPNIESDGISPYLHIWKQPTLADSALSDTRPTRNSSDIENLLLSLFFAATEENFEPGITNTFSEKLTLLLMLNSYEVFNAIKLFLHSEIVNEEVLGESLRVIGRSISKRYIRERFSLLLEGLAHSSPIVRDCSGLALADLGDSGAILYLENAAERESYNTLKEDLLGVAQDLKDEMIDETN